jgi:hypothetical protein
MKETITQTELIEKIRAILADHRGFDNRITRADLVAAVFGLSAAADKSNNNNYDRRVRAAIAEVRDVDLIVSTTKRGGGYYLAADLIEANRIAEDYVKRSRVMERKARAVRENARRKFGRQLDMLGEKSTGLAS